jgi:hypothetical protein
MTAKTVVRAKKARPSGLSLGMTHMMMMMMKMMKMKMMDRQKRPSRLRSGAR